MPVAGRIGGGAGADDAARAGEIFDKEILAKTFGEVLRDETRHHVGGAAGRVGDDDADLPRRIAWRRPARRILGMACGREHQRRAAGGRH